MIYYYGDRQVYADVFIRSLSFLLGEEVQHCSLDFESKESAPDLVLIDGENLHPQRLKKLLKLYKNYPIIMISDRGCKEKDVLAVVSNHAPIHHVADICRLILKKQVLRRNIGPSGIEELLLRELAQGCSDKELARTHGLTLSTVKYHLRNLYDKMGVNNRTQAALKAQETIL